MNLGALYAQKVRQPNGSGARFIRKGSIRLAGAPGKPEPFSVGTTTFPGWKKNQKSLNPPAFLQRDHPHLQDPGHH